MSSHLDLSQSSVSVSENFDPHLSFAIRLAELPEFEWRLWIVTAHEKKAMREGVPDEDGRIRLSRISFHAH
jgi:hypothetical protein